MTRVSTEQSTFPLPLLKYEGAGVSMMYPNGWSEMLEVPGSFSVAHPNECVFIILGWGGIDFEPSPMAEDRYGVNREILYGLMLEHREIKPGFEILREYRYGDAPAFECQYWEKDWACWWNVRIATYVDLQACQYVIVGWPIIGKCSLNEWVQEMNIRRALFDTVMQSITLKHQVGPNHQPSWTQRLREWWGRRGA